MEPVNRDEIMNKLKEQLENSPTIARSRADPLSKVIPVDDPLEPEKGGYQNAYQEHHTFNPYANNRKLNPTTGKLDPLQYNMGLKDIMPKLNIESGIQVDIPSEQLSFQSSDLRVISFQTAKNLGLEFKCSERFLLEDIHRSLSGKETALAPYWKRDGQDSYHDYYVSYAQLYKNKYFEASIQHGFLVSLDALKDREFVDILDKVSQSLNKEHLPKFDDNKYEAQFNKLGNYIEYINNNLLEYPVQYRYFQDSDRGQEAFSMDPRFTFAESKTPWSGLDKSPFAKLTDRMPFPSNFKSENDFLKAGAHLVTNNLIEKAKTDYQKGDTPDFKFNRNDNALMNKYGDTIKDIAGTMFAANFGVPLSQNEINRYNAQVYKLESKESDRVFNLAARVANYARDLDVSKEVAKNHEAPSSNLWDFWKKDNTRHVIQMATPSLNELCKQNNIAMNKDNVIKALNDLTSQKVNEVGQSKDPVKTALSQEQPINKELLNQTISSQSVEKSKEPQSKGLER